MNSIHLLLAFKYLKFELCSCAYPALLLVLAQRGVFENLFGNSQLLGLNSGRDKMMKEDGLLLSSSLVDMFADAIKGPLLSSDIQLQTNTLDLVFHTVSSGFSSLKQIQALIEKDIADYVFEVLRLSGSNFEFSIKYHISRWKSCLLFYIMMLICNLQETKILSSFLAFIFLIF